MSVVLILRRLRQEDHEDFEFKASPSYLES